MSQVDLVVTWSWMMENIVEFVARQESGFWLENDEWHHLE